MNNETPIIDNLLKIQKMANFDLDQAPKSCFNLFAYRQQCAKDYLKDGMKST